METVSRPKSKDFQRSGFVLRNPDIRKIRCRDCRYRARDRIEGAIKGATLAYCDVLDNKPVDVMFRYRECQQYRREDC